jgi:type I restriction enzyme S subunit
MRGFASSSFPFQRIKTLFRIVNGGTPTADPHNWGGDVIWVTPADLASVDGGIAVDSARHLSDEGLINGATSVPPKTLILSTRAPIGYIAMAGVDIAFNQGCKGLIALDEVVPRFYQYVLGAARTTLQALGNGTTFMELSSGSLGELKVPAPTTVDQRRIVKFLDCETNRIDELVAEQVRSTDLLWERRRASVFDAVTGRSVPGPRRQGVPWTDSIPSHWDAAKLASVATLGSGHTPSRSRPELWVDCSIPWITTGEVWQIRSDEVETLTETRELISQKGVEESSAVVQPTGTVVLCRTAASAGYSAIMGEDMATSQDFATWNCGPRLVPEYLLYCLRAMRSDLLGRLAMGSTHRTIYMPEIKSIVIPLPPKAEQESVVRDLRASLVGLDALRHEMEIQIGLLREHRQALITAAVTGQLNLVRSAA